jgi:hypothetical protein
MKTPKKLLVTGAVAFVLIASGTGAALTLIPGKESPKEVTVKQVAAVSELEPQTEKITQPETQTQESAPTQSQPTPQVQPSNNTASTEQQAADAPIPYDPNAVVASIDKVDVGRGWEECQLNFSDGSVYRRSWKMVRNGVVEYEGICDDSLVGTLKSVN